jgi:glucose 1-dehydrogenase
VDSKKTGNSVLAGQRALVTGANSGIGAAIAQALAAAGTKVVVNYLCAPEVAKRIVERIKAGGGEAMAIQADITQEDQVKRMFQQMIEAWGSIDILVNNAGCVQKETAVIDMSLADWEHVLRVNLTGQFLCAREAAREFLRRGVVPELSCSAGKIICISSVHDTIP